MTHDQARILSSPLIETRQHRCTALGLTLDTVHESALAAITCSQPLTAIVCSRIGHDPHRHRRLAQQIAASLQQARRDGVAVLVADDTAIAPWVTHAAELFQVPVIRLERTADRDRYMIAIADRVDAAYVRGGGKVTALLRQRAELQAGTVRVAIDSTMSEHRVVWELLDAGAVGHFLPEETVNEESDIRGASVTIAASEIDWSNYLVHCTRSAAGPWPGQTWTQYRDDMLLADPRAAARDTIDTLCRIVRMQRLVAGALVSHQKTLVVCFSAVELPKLLAARVYRSHLHRWDYEPFGIAIAHDAAKRIGAEKVIYGNSEERSKLAEDQRYRFQASGTTYDWTAEQEWRLAGDLDLNKLDRQDVIIFVANDTAADRVSLVNRSNWTIVQVG